ncbi:MAG TPA: hypothetical protein VHT51_00960, partial [Micropepsaceae bacterium]|nr:hypothetical protein [Micropepsaceae bacterium]
TAELRYDYLLGMSSSLQALQPYVFFDAARVWNVQNAALPGQGISSTGAGVRFWLAYNIFGDIEAAQTLAAVQGSDDGKRATKVLLNIAIRF